MSSLPDGWEERALLEIVSDISYGYTAKSNRDRGDARMLRITDIQNDKVDWNTVPFCEISGAQKGKYALRKMDLVFARTGATVGKSFLIREPVQDAVFASYLIRVRCVQSGMANYLKRFFDSPAYWNQITEISAGIAQPNVNGSKLGALKVPLAPLPEQKRIADKLDAVLTRVDACRERLDRVPAILKRFRLSVLAAATTGRLTQDWRTADEGMEGWSETSFATVIRELRNGLSPKPAEHPPGSKILRISAVRPGKVDLTDHRFLNVGAALTEQYALRAGDLLFTRYNGSLEFVGVCALVRAEPVGYVYPDKLIRVRLDESKALPEYIEIAFGGDQVRRQVEAFVKSSAGQKGISGADLKTTRLRFPPLDEQREIIRRVQTLFAFADRLDGRLAQARATADRLSPAILAKAFRGELVPQDPNDEPASELLKRLAEGRSTTGTVTKNSRGRKTTRAVEDEEESSVAE
jgi:type I restriction enzyme S subunit